LLSGYFSHRDPNQGACTNSCRWDYKIYPGSEDATGDIYLLEEGGKADALMPIEEDMHGTYILNSKDLRAIEHIQRLTEMGIDSFKIEGRTKSPYYVARTCQSYRTAIDDAFAGKPFQPKLLGHLEGLANRGYTAGFYERHPDAQYQNYLKGFSISGRSMYVGHVLEIDPERGVKIEVKNRFAVGDRIEIIEPTGTLDVTIEALWNLDGQSIAVAPGAGHIVYAKIPCTTSSAYLARYIDSPQESAKDSPKASNKGSSLDQIRVLTA